MPLVGSYKCITALRLNTPSMHTSSVTYFTSLKPSAVLQISVKAVLYKSSLMVFRFIYQNVVSKPERFSKDGKLGY